MTLSVVAAFTVTVLRYDSVAALSICTEVEVIGVRGSGQEYGESSELIALKKLLPSAYDFDELESGLAGIEYEPAYEAEMVVGNWRTNIFSGGLAVVDKASFGIYRNSVDSGKNLLKKYIEHLNPTGACVALVGYSQGAQVINETVRDMHKANPDSLSKVIYIGLLGDPLYSPYGFDKTVRPTWLRGNALFPFWGVLYKDQANIVVGETIDYVPRNPANPNLPFTKIGSWCNYGDVICATNATHYAAMRDGHGSYLEEGIPDLVDEIKAAVANPDQNITAAIYPSAVCGAAKQDMVVLLDTSAYMRRNKELFTNAKNSWDTKRIPGTTQLAYRTFGEQLLDSGCGDKRIAIVGFDGAVGQSPRLLLDFTTQAIDIDTLMNSLHAPSTGGTVERPKLREAAILGMQQNWRPDASRTLLAVTSMAGSGPAPTSTREVWNSPATMDLHMSDAVGQQLLALSRKTRASIITAPNLPIDMSGFTAPAVGPGSLNWDTYVQGLSKLTGGYNWAKVFVQYAPFSTARNVDFSSSIQQFEKRRDSTRVGMQSVRAKVGETVTLSLDDTMNLLAAAAIRNNGTATEWYMDCDALQKQTTFPVVQQSGSKISFKPTKAGSCTAMVRVAVQANGNGCYSGCPEPFPPYMLKTIPFKLEVRPVGYIEKVPGAITSVSKTIYDDRVEVAWLPPGYTGNTSDLMYMIKDHDGSVLAMTSETKATITDTNKLDADVSIQAIGSDGVSAASSTSEESVSANDERTADVATTDPPFSLGTIVNAITEMIGTSQAPVLRTATAVNAETSSESDGEGYALGESDTEDIKTTTSLLPDKMPESHQPPIVGDSSVMKWWWLLPTAIVLIVIAFGIRSALRR